jgi:hypothetical protein
MCIIPDNISIHFSTTPEFDLNWYKFITGIFKNSAEKLGILTDSPTIPEKSCSNQ